MKVCCKCSENCNKNKKESLRAVYGNLKKSKLLGDVFLIFLGIIILVSGNEICFCISSLVILICSARITYKILFNAKEKFNQHTTILMGIGYFLLTAVVLFGNLYYRGSLELFKSYIFALPILVLLFALYFWLVYLACCLKVVKKIGKDRYVFLAKSAESMLEAVLVCFSSSIVVWLLPEKESIIKLYYHFINIFINITYPLLNMYIGTRLELDDYIGKIDKKD